MQGVRRLPLYPYNKIVLPWAVNISHPVTLAPGHGFSIYLKPCCSSPPVSDDNRWIKERGGFAGLQRQPQTACSRVSFSRNYISSLSWVISFALKVRAIQFQLWRRKPGLCQRNELCDGTRCKPIH